MRYQSSSAQQALSTLGSRLREIRCEAGLSGRDLAALAGWHSSKVSKIEYGRQTPTVQDISAWCQHCGADDQAADLITSLHAVEGMFIEWRRIERGGLLYGQQRLVHLWQSTRRFRVYSSNLVPGTVQTYDYACAVLCTIQQRLDLPDDAESAAQARVDRQQVIYQPGRQFAIVIEEGVLHYSIGSPEVMAAQLGHLLTISTLPAVSLGIIPLTAPRTAWPEESFWIFDRAMASVELISGELSITQPYEIAMYEQMFDELSAQAVYGAPARKLIADAIAATAA